MTPPPMTADQLDCVWLLVLAAECRRAAREWSITATQTTFVVEIAGRERNHRATAPTLADAIAAAVRDAGLVV